MNSNKIDLETKKARIREQIYLDEYRKPFLQTMSVIELICVGNNIGIGLRMKF